MTSYISLSTTVRQQKWLKKQEHGKLPQAGTLSLKGGRWVWLEKSAGGRSGEAALFLALNQHKMKISRAWGTKENSRQFWCYSLKVADKHIFKSWTNNPIRSRLWPVKKVVKMLRRHEEVSSNIANTESVTPTQSGLYSAIQLFKANARPLSEFTNLRAMFMPYSSKQSLDSIQRSP